jgi:hypothetical protein
MTWRFCAYVMFPQPHTGFKLLSRFRHHAMVHSFISALSLLKLVPRQECMLSTYFMEAVWQFYVDSFKKKLASIILVGLWLATS